ncbi:ATP-binding protein [Pseudomonas sp. TH31]|uniref:ATP-binding protein n=1 Tax=Pseudomonas sp. TH31 TaxID=2796396 RepID=UPI001911C985|nr:ATP-binding protein [Pseudomonas sp. TH31]MBK5415838.1 ATP-binding protein [Pseudomonas sp. TH31]
MDDQILNNPEVQRAQMTVRARAVDMLGRQQIAGVPSAVHELFKNAYDAFAQRVEVDVLRQQKIFMLRDDGIGMTHHDFINRWLTVGTESKLGTKISTAPWLGDYGKIKRHVLGEKGIGRLAIAVIGPAVLILTRASREDGLHDLVVALVHWGLFEIPGIGLDQVVVPIRTFKGDDFPGKADIDAMIAVVLSSLDGLEPNLTSDSRQKIESDLQMMSFDPSSVYNGLKFRGVCDDVASPLFEGGRHGTHFIIRPYDEILELDLEDDAQLGDGRTSKLQTLLVGFSNTMFPDMASTPIRAFFRDHKGEVFTDLIDDKVFIGPEDFEAADHQVDGEFDEYGKFVGTVKVYDQPKASYTLSYPLKSAIPLQCGPFKIRFGYSQGYAHQSLLDSTSHGLLSAKLAKHGGLYVYRDGIRVLPYGDIEHDFLRIEQRRNKAHKDWFFSFRRMFGAIVLDNVENQALREKAGREGFQENAAFRQFRGVLEFFLMSLAKDYFRKDAPLGNEFNRLRDEMENQNKLLKIREKRVSVRKEKLQHAINQFFVRVEEGDVAKEAEKFRDDLLQKFNLVQAVADPDEMTRELQIVERELRVGLDALRKLNKISRPRGVGLNKEGEADWARYRTICDEIESTVYYPIEGVLQEKLAEILHERGDAIDRRGMLRDGLAFRKGEMEKLVKAERRLARDIVEQSQQDLRFGIETSFQRFRNTVEDALSDFDKTDLKSFDDSSLVTFQSMLQQKLEVAAVKEQDFLSNLRSQLESLSEGVKDGLLPDDLSAALEGQNLSLREDLSDSMYWAQIGMALGVVQHEFDAVAKTVKKGIKDLKPWADKNPALSGLFKGLHSGFAHLEEYLSLFSPLDRRLYRTAMDLSGGEISNYIENVFADRFERHSIIYSATSDFLSGVISAYPSTIYPVLINVIDNACHWVSKEIGEKRWIKLERHKNGIVIRNGGVGIDRRHAEQIFEFGFSEKHNGRGMGLAISRKALRRDELDLILTNPGRENNPAFLLAIKFIEDDDGLFEQGVLGDE